MRRARKSELLAGDVAGERVVAKRLARPNAVWAWYLAREVAIYRAFAEAPPGVRVPRLIAAADDILIVEWLRGEPIAALRHPRAALPVATLTELIAIRDALARWPGRAPATPSRARRARRRGRATLGVASRFGARNNGRARPIPTRAMPFQKSARLSVGSLDKPDLSVEAQYNPKELQLDRPVPWAKHNLSVEGSSAKARKENEDAAKADRGLLHLEFNGAESRTITLELLFDEYESKATVRLQRNVAMLDEMARVIDPFSPRESDRRPHFCVVSFGNTLRRFSCVIESLSVKFTMFDREGDPLRAACTVKLKEADRLSTSDKEKEQFSGDKTPARR